MMNRVCIDTESYSSEQLDEIENSIRKELVHEGLTENVIQNRLFALCMESPLRLLACLEIIRKGGGSLLLIHADTPHQTCLELARESGCHYLLFNGEKVSLQGKNLYRDSSLVQFSSGTTGKPKQIVRSWENIRREIFNYNKLLSAEEDEAPIILVPATHSFGLIAGIMTAFERGATPHIVINRNPKFYMKIIGGYQKHIVYGVPFQFHLMHALAPHFVFNRLLSSGAPLQERLFRDLEQNGSGIMQQYGCTECGCISLSLFPEGPNDNGRPLEHFTIETSTSASEPTEIIAKTDRSIVHTRDLGYFSDKGSLFVLNRLDDLINVSGQKVIPSEVEEVISRLEGIKETVVYGARHTIWGECVGALIVSEKQYDVAAVKNHCMKHLPAYKIPAKIRFVEEIPKTEKGKISRSLIKSLENQNTQKNGGRE